MKNVKLNHRPNFSFLSKKFTSKKTLINSLSPNFFYVNKIGGIVHPVQVTLY